MRRREFVAFLGGAVAWPLAAQTMMAKVLLVSFHSPTLAGHVEHLRAGLREYGWIEGRNLQLEAHFTSSSPERAREVLKAALGKGVDVVVAWTAGAAQIARELTRTVPVVMIASDPVLAKLVDSLSRPGGNLTGVSMTGPDLAGKGLEVLREIRPALRKVAFVGSKQGPGAAAYARELQAAAKIVRLELVVRIVDSANAFDDSFFEALRRESVEAVFIQPVFTGAAGRIVPGATKAGLPLIGQYPPFAEAGALLTLGVDEAERVRRSAYYVHRILKGAHPRDLPIEQATSVQLVINTAAAKKLGWTIPAGVLARADRVIN